ncbi:MAG: hypothetical protein GF418_08885 [Chitinivibrionales bacterium]|nr:hypothetical protein [Chitinivibrionales bacterium]MBD3395728.1 hypothetical protein [Chitinivibrionales bacterium]
MKEHGLLITGSVLAFLLAVGVVTRITMQKASFNRTVQEALETSEGYDERFIEMVNKLEEELARRASFGYKGQKDPMTGKKRAVVLHHKPIRRRLPAKKEDKEPEQYIDPVKLTAIIYDDEKRKHTAIVMDGERSYSVEVGDRVRDRTITRITNEQIFMESPAALFRYDIYGNSAMKKRGE